ncbi:hypothetical protein E2C01_074831 [Portunus trituberculatus]|uniref:Uncharacterized protein n=1 Tax=Portunus trituberculatus TaxID=210409 RepID=A0A5B7IFA8_PORTR|nr:hypothetical protein [Portunus trituberculatus]
MTSSQHPLSPEPVLSDLTGRNCCFGRCLLPPPDACYRAPSHDIMGYLSAHWPKPPSRPDQFGYHVFGYSAAISATIGRDSRGLSVQ